MNHTATLSPQAKVWIYQSNRTLTAEESTAIAHQLQQFAAQWVSHNDALKANAELRHGRFIILQVDETQVKASGCSIDASVRFLRQLEQQYNLDLFDRLTFAYQTDTGNLAFAPRDTFAKLYQQGTITDDTLVFDNLVKTKAEFDQAWLKPLRESWHARMV